MPRRTEPYLWDDMNIFVSKAGRLITNRYEKFGADSDDVTGQMWAWVYANETRIRRWLASDPQQTTRIFRSLYDEALRYCEKEKAQSIGYKPDDVQWYSPSLVQAVLPFALDEGWNGMAAEHGVPAKQDFDVISIVVDVRDAIYKTHTYDILLQLNPGDDAYEDAVRAVVDALGGARSYVGRRRVVTNSAAQHYDDWETA